MRARDKRQKIFQAVYTTLSSSLLLLMLTLIDALSLGRQLLAPKIHNRSTEAISIIFFIYPTIIAQIVFGVFTNIDSGIAAGAILELVSTSQEISKVCGKHTLTFDSAMFCTYICFFLATMLYSAMSLALKTYNAGNLLQLIPSTATYAAMSCVGLASLDFGYKEIYVANTQRYMHFFFLIALSLAVIALFLEKKYPGSVFILPGFFALILASFYITTFAFGLDRKWLVSHYLIPEKKKIKDNLSIWELFKYFSIDNIKPLAILYNLQNIITMALLSIIHIPVNISGFSTETGIQANLNQELETQGVANLICSFLGFPTYFICSYSILFAKSGGISRLHSVVAGFLFFVIVIYGASARSLLPSILLAFIPLYIGLSFMYSYLIAPLMKLSILDSFIFVVPTAFAFYNRNPVIGLALGVILNYIAYLVVKYLAPKCYQSEKPIYALLDIQGRNEGSGDIIIHHDDRSYVYLFSSNFRIIRLEGVYTSRSKDYLRSILSGLDEDVLVDLRNCHYMDLDSNIILEETIKELSEGNNAVVVVGSPYNCYKHAFERIPGVSVVG